MLGFSGLLGAERQAKGMALSGSGESSRVFGVGQEEAFAVSMTKCGNSCKRCSLLPSFSSTIGAMGACMSA